MATRWKGSVAGGAAPRTPTPSTAPQPEIGQARHDSAGAATPVSREEQDAREYERAVLDAQALGGAANGVSVVWDNAEGWKAEITNQDLFRESRLPPLAPKPTLPTDPMGGGTESVVIVDRSGPAQNFGPDGLVKDGRVNAFGNPSVIEAAPPVPAIDQGPAEVDRARIDALLNNTSKATSGLMALGQRDLQFSQAQAQLRQGLEQGQRQALSLARSGNRRDRAANESRAIQAGTELAAQTGQAAAGLRATEEAAQQQIRLDAYKAAGDLGLNAGALDLNVQALDMNAATNFLNQLFARENLQLQIDQREAERVTNFVRDMALIEKDYYALSQAERDAVRQDLTRRYGISEQTRIALTALDKSDDINWGQLAIAGIGGLITGSAQVGAALATKSATGGAA